MVGCEAPYVHVDCDNENLGAFSRCGPSMRAADSQARAARIAMSLSDIDTVPPVITKAIETLKDPRLSSQDLAKLISMDHHVTARLIAMANAAHFEESGALDTVRDAIMSLGYRNTQAILYATSAQSVLCQPVTLHGMERNELWRHSVACAVSSRTVAKEFDLWDPDEAYVAGLLHDIGLPALERFARRKSKIVDLIRTANHPPYMAEQMVLGFDHAYLGSLMCQNWQLADDLITAVSTHHEPLSGEDPTALSAIVNVADTVSQLPGVGICNRPMPVNADPQVVHWLGFELTELERLVPLIRSHLKRLGQVS